MSECPNIIGIDYGSKTAGTTAIAYLQEHRIQFTQSVRKKDADQFIRQFVKTHHPQQIFIDAPLSLPGVFQGLPQHDDFFYRVSDREVKAMSPMFLGGLTARAMKLKHEVLQWDDGIRFHEVYPGHLARLLGLDRDQYKKKMEYIPQHMEVLAPLLPYDLDRAQCQNWHQFDALLAFLSGARYNRGEHKSFGNPQEGIILV